MSSPTESSMTAVPATEPRELSVAKAAGVAMRSVTKQYGSVKAIANMTLDIAAGTYCCLLGPSGCGKTTALRTIAGHETVSSGDIYIGDRRVTHLSPAKRDTAMMFQNYALFPHKTIWQNIEFGLRMKKIDKVERDRRVGEMLELVRLSHASDRHPHMLSGGQQQRIALARALVNRPKVLLLDEPLSALDENLRVQMRGELRSIQRQFGLTFIQVTHHVEEAFSLSDRIVVMDGGQIDQIATPTELFNRPACKFVAQFLGEHNIFTGKVLQVTAATDRPDLNGQDLIELAVDGIGSLFCYGIGLAPGTEAACSVRPDLIALEPTVAAGSVDSTSIPTNQVIARIVDVELTGYVTRVSLIVEATGQSLLYKVRTTDWQTSPQSESDRVILHWSALDCVFLPH
ncbi:ABC transporter ATP-binding protein [Roseofilum casamattae]|uniref:ABC transporter ATP-binding protein n=1 Tax=Roseofilum casamattae BLCC-M143 TaxID=3022442 RepID=A0ABT7BUK1_9CYAN|nr:ABC transporter ATP-binding protein [Roseofilum casamattae]MDJ1182166.1 ABC transporter ATP-binding protein [Roseofilum casamattae BLCC-M143]